MLDEYENTQIIAHKILKNAILNDEYSHAYLFETNGFQKSNDFIMSFVKSVLCPHKKTNQKDCEDCNQCKIIDSGNFPEIKIICSPLGSGYFSNISVAVPLINSS